MMVYDNLTVGYKSGLWSISFKDIGGRPVKLMTVILSTPVESRVCTGIYGSLGFNNCPASEPPNGPYAANATFTGFASGAGAGSATPGQTYTVTIAAIFSDGSAYNDTSTVTASSG